MSRTQIESSLNQLNALVLEGKMLEAFDTYYHEEVTMQENDLPATIGKQLNREREIEFLHNITEFRAAAVEGVSVSDDLSVVIWSYDYTHKDWGVRKYTQASVQHWKDGKIISEKFIYLN